MLYHGVNYTHWDCKILQVQKTPPSFSLIWKLLLKKRCNLHIIIPFQVLIPSSVNIHARSSPVVCRLWAFELSSFSALPIPTSDSQPWSPLDLLSKPFVMYIFFFKSVLWFFRHVHIIATPISRPADNFHLGESNVAFITSRLSQSLPFQPPQAYYFAVVVVEWGCWAVPATDLLVDVGR